MISVVVPLYNKEKYIKKTINSVLKQTYSEFELIIVNDGSTDKSIDLVNEIKDKRIRIINKKNGGPSSARNRGVVEAKGDWVIFLDADDILLPFALEHFNYLISNIPNIEYFVCNYFLLEKGQLKIFSYRKFNGIIPNNFYFEVSGYLTDRPGSAIYSRKLLLKNPFNEKLRRYEDAESQYNIMRMVKIYQSSLPVMISDRDAISAAMPRSTIKEDFLGYLDFTEKSFWEKVTLYWLALNAKNSYPSESKDLYHYLYKRLDFKLYFKIFVKYTRVMKYFYKLTSKISKTIEIEDVINITDIETFKNKYYEQN